MKTRLLAMTIPAIFAASFLGCSSAPVDNETANSTSPVLDTDTVQHIVADLAVNLMRRAAVQGMAGAPCYANTILASQRYDISGGKLIFRVADVLNRSTAVNPAAPGADKKCVTDEMRAMLDIVQQDPEVAAFLTAGQTTAKTTTNGQYFPSVDAIEALGKYVFPTVQDGLNVPKTIPLAAQTFTITDYSAIGPHQVTVSWVPLPGGSTKIVLKDTLKTYLEYSPFRKREVTNPTSLGSDLNKWLVGPQGLGYAGTNQNNQHPYTPFAGASGNPYLIISYNNSATTYWSNYFTTMSTVWCGNGCSGYLEIDPVPYAEPAAAYSTNPSGQQILLGTQENPFTIVGTIWAAAEHKCDYATLGSNVGRFANPRTNTMVTPPLVQYGFVKMALIANYTNPDGTPICP